MRKLFGALLVLLLSVGAALWLRDQGGFVIVRLGAWTVEMSVILFTGAVLATAILVYLLLGLLRKLLGAPRRVRGWLGRRKQNRVRQHLIEGLIRTAEGRYAEAEKALTKNVQRSESPVLHYLAAAIAAQRQHAPERRDRYLALADNSNRRAQLAVSLIQAQLLYESGQYEQALASLNYLHERSPRHPGILQLLMKCCLALKDWERLTLLLPELRRQGVVDETKALELEGTVARHRLEKAARENDRELDRIWSGLSKPAREDNDTLLVYVNALKLHNRDGEIERVLRNRLNKRWHGELAACYGTLKHDPAKLLAQLEKWLKERPEDPVLLEATGRMCLRNKLWGRARSLFEAAVARNPQPQSYQALGGLLEQMGETDAARDCFRKAVELVTHHQTLEELTDADRSALAMHGQPGQAAV